MQAFELYQILYDKLLNIIRVKSLTNLPLIFFVALRNGRFQIATIIKQILVIYQNK